MSTIAERIKGDAAISFKENFDLDVFLKYVEDELRSYRHVDIGIIRAYGFGSCSNYMKSKAQYRGGEYATNMPYPTFAKNHECYVWKTDCQIPHQFVDNVIGELHKQGLRTSQKGACGYDTYDVISVTL